MAASAHRCRCEEHDATDDDVDQCGQLDRDQGGHLFTERALDAPVAEAGAIDGKLRRVSIGDELEEARLSMYVRGKWVRG